MAPLVSRLCVDAPTAGRPPLQTLLRAPILFNPDDDDGFSKSTLDLAKLQSMRYEIFNHNAPARQGSEDRTIMVRTSGNGSLAKQAYLLIPVRLSFPVAPSLLDHSGEVETLRDPSAETSCVQPAWHAQHREDSKPSKSLPQ